MCTMSHFFTFVLYLSAISLSQCQTVQRQRYLEIPFDTPEGTPNQRGPSRTAFTAPTLATTSTTTQRTVQASNRHRFAFDDPQNPFVPVFSIFSVPPIPVTTFRPQTRAPAQRDGFFRASHLRSRLQDEQQAPATLHRRPSQLSAEIPPFQAVKKPQIITPAIPQPTQTFIRVENNPPRIPTIVQPAIRAPVPQVNRNPSFPDHPDLLIDVHSVPVDEPAELQRIRGGSLTRPDSARNLDEEESSRQRAQYSFASQIDDSISGHQHQREETRDGLNVKGMYSYSDGYVKRTVYYEADEHGYRVVKEEEEPLGGSGPKVNPNGQASVSSFVDGNAVSYSITAADIRDEKNIGIQGERV